MTANIPLNRKLSIERNNRQNKHAAGKCGSHAEVQEMLRDIAFVLKMTQRVRESIEAGEVTQEPMLV